MESLIGIDGVRLMMLLWVIDGFSLSEDFWIYFMSLLTSHEVLNGLMLIALLS